MGRWSELVAAEFIPWFDAAGHSIWIDVGCGTGRLTRTIDSHAEPELVVGLDPSHGFAAFARRRSNSSRFQFIQGDGLRMPIADDRFDAAMSGLVLNFVPDPNQMLDEMARVVRPEGDLGWYVWDYHGMEFLHYFWEAAIGLDSHAAELEERVRFSDWRPDVLRTMAETTGLRSVQVHPIDVPTRFRNFEDYWRPFLGAQGPAPTYVAGRSPEQRLQLRERLESTLPTEDEGTIDLNARAWGVRGRVASNKLG